MLVCQHNHMTISHSANIGRKRIDKAEMWLHFLQWDSQKLTNMWAASWSILFLEAHLQKGRKKSSLYHKLQSQFGFLLKIEIK